MTVTSHVTSEQAKFISGVAGKLSGFMSEQRDLMASVSPDVEPLIGSISNLVTGGKRLRA